MTVRSLPYWSAGVAAALLVAAVLFGADACAGDSADAAAKTLAEEVAQKGWLVFGARADNGTWDLFLMRPDGSRLRNITNTPDVEEAAPRFSPDGKRILFRVLKKGARIDHDRWGFQGRAAIADADGSNVRFLGEEEEYPWASWGPEGKTVSCLKLEGIEVVDLASGEVLKKLPRKGIYQQLTWAPDGSAFCGAANFKGQMWTVVRLDAETGEINAVREFQNCTPDWHPNSDEIIFSSRPAGQPGADGYGFTQLWMANEDGSNPRLVYGEDGMHIYGGGFSPDGKYVHFARCPADGGGSEANGAPICIMRAADAPTIAGPSEALRKVHPQTKDGPVLQLVDGWEPCWTYYEIPLEDK